MSPRGPLSWAALASAWLLACADPLPESLPLDRSARTWTLHPPELQFGETRIGVPVTGEVTFTNTSAEDLTLIAVESTAEAFSATAVTDLPVAPGESTAVTVTLTPPGEDYTSASVRLRVAGPYGEDLGFATASVSWAGVGPDLHVNPESADLGVVSRQCLGSAILTVSNLGNEDLTVESIGFDDADGFGLDFPNGGGHGSEPPWLLFPLDAREVHVAFTPLAEGDVAAKLLVRSDDQLNPVVAVPFQLKVAESYVNSESFEVTDVEPVTALFAANAVITTTYAARFEAALPSFFDALRAGSAPYRIAFTTEANGSVSGAIPYIDQTMSSSEATEVALDMVAGAWGDNDTLLDALDKSIDRNESWLMVDDEEGAWSTSQLNLIGINSDQEQSSGDSTYYVAHYLAWKDDPTDIAVHGIGGDDPGGCPGAEPFTPFADAARATGGVFLSICDEDWIPNLQRLATAFGAFGRTAFRLSDIPAPDTTTVYVDGAEVSRGWSLDTLGNFIYFEPEAAPAVGSEVRVDYEVTTRCPE